MSIRSVTMPRSLRPARKPRYEFINHTGTKAQFRYLNNECRPILDSTDERILALRDRLLGLTYQLPNAGLAALSLMHLAIAVHRQQDTVSLPDIFECLIDKFEVEEKQRKEVKE